MKKQPSLSLLVLRVADFHRALEFYSVLGLEFAVEQHGSGPEHYAASLEGGVLELYPATDRYPVRPLRFGLTVDSLEELMVGCRALGCRIASQPKPSRWGLHAVVVDPDGHQVELLQPNMFA